MESIVTCKKNPEVKQINSYITVKTKCYLNEVCLSPVISILLAFTKEKNKERSVMFPVRDFTCATDTFDFWPIENDCFMFKSKFIFNIIFHVHH